MGNTANLQHEFAFWTGFYPQDCSKESDAFTWASEKAYLDMNRTMTFRDIPVNNSKDELERVEFPRRQRRDRGTDIIRQQFRQMYAPFDRWHREACHQLIGVYGTDFLVRREGKVRTSIPDKLTYGQAQKWLNMTLKYLWLLHRFGMLPEEDGKIVDAFGHAFHVPLDSYVLRYISRQDKSKAAPFSAHCRNGLDPEISFRREWEQFGSTWSRISDADGYYLLQQKLAQAAKDRTPLEWELVHWHLALKYYG